MTTSATPRTDALLSANGENIGLDELAVAFNQLVDHARQLEYELAESYKKGYRDGAIQALNDASTTKEKP